MDLFEPSALGSSLREPCSCARVELGKNERGQIGCGQIDRGSCGRASVGHATVGCAAVGCATVGGMTVVCVLPLVDPACSPGLERMFQAYI